jgi:hypothetical protein
MMINTGEGLQMAYQEKDVKMAEVLEEVDLRRSQPLRRPDKRMNDSDVSAHARVACGVDGIHKSGAKIGFAT